MNDINKIDAFIASHPNFKNQKPEKREHISDMILACVARTNTDIDRLMELIKLDKALDVTCLGKNSGNVFDYIEPSLLGFARKIFNKKGNGTPNAASGKGELMFCFMSYMIKDPTKGDIECNDDTYEFKTNGGKISKGSGIEVNAEVVKKCRKARIKLPVAATGKTAKGKPQFIPCDPKHQRALGKKYITVLSYWWKALSGKSLPKNIKKWDDLVPHVITVLAKPVFDSNDAIVCFDKNGDFEIFRKPKDLLESKYNSKNAQWEMRCYQKNPIALYLGQ